MHEKLSNRPLGGNRIIEKWEPRLEQLNEKLGVYIIPSIKDISRRIRVLVILICLNTFLLTILLISLVLWIILVGGEN